MRKTSFALTSIIIALLLSQHYILVLPPVYKTIILSVTVLLWLAVGIILFVKKDRRKTFLVTYIVLACAIFATTYFTFDKVVLKELFIDSNNETITAVFLRCKDGNNTWRWYPSEAQALPDTSAAVINGGSAEALLQGLNEVTAQNYYFGSKVSEPVIADYTIFTSDGNRLTIYEGNGSFAILANGHSLRGEWIFSQPLSDYIPAEILESVCNE